MTATVERVLAEVRRARVHGKVYNVKVDGSIAAALTELHRSGLVTYDRLVRGDKARYEVWAARPAFHGTCTACEREHCHCWDDAYDDCAQCKNETE
jgi:hypothetical protein